LTFYSSKKVALFLIRDVKKFLQNWACRVSKEAEFCADFKNVLKSRVWQKGKLFYRKTEFLGTWKILQKIVFLRKKFGNFLTQEFYTFLKSAQNSASFDTQQQAPESAPENVGNLLQQEVRACPGQVLGI
jgi:hypothetical protein